MKLSATISVSRRPRTDNEAELASVITNKTMQMGLKDFDQAVKDLKGAGIVVGEDQMTLEASKVKITNNGTTAALFTDGKISADYIDVKTLDAKTIVTNGLSANTIDANKATLKNLTAENFTLTSGKIAGFEFDSTSIGTADSSGTVLNNMYMNKNCIIFNGASGKQAMIGATGILGTDIFARLTNTVTSTDARYGLLINMNNGQSGNTSYINEAIRIEGGTIGGLNLHTSYISSSGKTIDNYSNAVLLACSTSGFTVKMPNFGQSSKYNGHVIMIKRYGSETPTLQCQGYNAFLFQEGQVAQSNASMAWNGCSATFVFFPHITLGSYKGIWVEWRGIHAE